MNLVRCLYAEKRKTPFSDLHFYGSLATKFLYVKTVSDEVVRHSLAHLYVQKWLVGTSV